jgi:hypothetical protein
MYDEEQMIPYDGVVEIPKEIQKIRDPIIFNLTKRELLFVSMGLMMAAVSFWGLYRWMGVRNPVFVLLPVLIASPCLLFAFIRPMGLNLEDWLTIWMSNNIKSAPVRKLFAQNAYEKAWELAKAHEEKARGVKKKNGWKRKSRGRTKGAGNIKKQKSIYKIRQ